jgi:hypothetical protein
MPLIVRIAPPRWHSKTRPVPSTNFSPTQRVRKFSRKIFRIFEIFHFRLLALNILGVRSNNLLSDPIRPTFMKEKTRERARAKRLMDNYKLTVEDYEAMLKYQGGVCCVCRQPEPTKGRRLSVDHNHTTGLIRGLLCSRCNPILGKIENAFKRYALGKAFGLDVSLLLYRTGDYLEALPAIAALGREHIGYIGRIGTKAHRKRIKKERKRVTPSVGTLTR